MKQLLRICGMAVGSGAVCCALGVGAWWCVNAFPAPREMTETPAAPRKVGMVRPAGIPWERDPDDVNAAQVSLAWIPGEKAPKGSRPTRGGTPPPAWLPRGRVEPGELAAVDAAFAKGKGGVDQGIKGVEQIIKENPPVAAAHFRSLESPWPKALIAAGRPDEVDRISGNLLELCAYDTRIAEWLLMLRFRLAEMGGLDQQALWTGRQLFAICPMYDVNRVVGMVMPVLTKGRPKAFAARMRASLGGASADGDPALSLRIGKDDPPAAVCAGAAREEHGEDYGALTARGNLLLLAGDADGAERVFRRAYMMAAPRQVEVATENFARCEKARTGTIGAANAWLRAHGKESGR